ncbi:nuclear transport factor 2 family protein [Francisella sp. LA112445]|uniref:nuclear transport factor 2 family protein n=1 Tax=Francisella sp. LA112445 TaxID=1395624 RepID=UPI001788DECC|nr:nuclear transport factor 2 family protein [Francisella sp. LA112445]QIW10957.1 nuclear transport factor 2 family protein [Francisella sp. LA112445]
MSKTNLEIIKDFLNFQKTGQPEKVIELIDNNAAWHSDSIEGPWSGSHHGKDAIIKHFTNIKASVSEFKKTPIDLVASEETNFVYEYAYLECTFQHNNEFFETHLISIYEVKDQKIVSYRVLEDSNNLYQTYHKQASGK